MKKLIITLLAAMLASGAFAQAFPDIPENHWAGDAVERIADLGIVIGFPDGTFRGNESFTRYQAALVVSRMLDVLNENIEARVAMTEEDLASLRNAVEELSSDVASQESRLSSAESAVEGLEGDVQDNAARLDELEAAVADMDGEVDPAVLEDLENQIASQRVAIDTAQSAADEAQAAADEALARANEAASAANANAEEIAALNDLVQLLSNQLDELESQVGGLGEGPDIPADLEDRVARNEGDIANIREFVILLRRDQVALRDRVSALEASDEQQSADIADLQERVTELEENPLGLSGSIELEYFVGRHVGDGFFDVDRAFGLNNDRDMGASAFSTGSADLNDDDDETDVGEVAQDRPDIEEAHTFTSDLTIDIGAGTTFGSEGSPNALNAFDASVSLTVETGWLFEENDTDSDLFEGYVFTIDEFTTTFDFVGAEPLTFVFGEEVAVNFTPYTWNEEDQGFRADIGAPDMLQFLDPTLQVAYLSNPDETPDEPQEVATGVRATVSPADFLTLGGSFVRDAVNTADKDDVLGNNTEATVWGVDGTVALGPAEIVGEFAQSSESGGGAAFAELDVDGDALPIITSFEANYRDIAGDWEASTPTDSGDYPYDQDQAGAGVEVGLGLFVVDVTGYFDTYETGSPNATTTAFGVDAEAELFAGFDLTGFFHQASATFEDGTVDGTVDSTEAIGTERDDNDYDTGFGVGLEHDGDADNALIDNLDLEFAYEQLGVTFDQQHILAAADYELSVSIVNLTPYVAYESFNDAGGRDGSEYPASHGPLDEDDTDEIRVGTGLTTEPLDVFLAPSLEAAVNYRTTSHTLPADYTAEELQWSVGLALNEFLWENSTLSARYGSYAGTNVSTDTALSPEATNISAGDENNDLTQSVNGYEVEWNYYDLNLAYGVYTHEHVDNDTNTAVEEGSAQAFRVGYTVDF